GRPEQSPRFSTNEVQQGKFRPWSLNRRIITTSPKAQGWYSHCLNYFVSRLERNDRVGTNSECLPAGSESLMSDKPKIRDDSERELSHQLRTVPPIDKARENPASSVQTVDVEQRLDALR